MSVEQVFNSMIYSIKEVVVVVEALGLRKQRASKKL